MNPPIPPATALPSRSALRRAALIAVILAATLVVTVILPAERAIDPTGVGALLGLTEMGESKLEAAEEAEYIEVMAAWKAAQATIAGALAALPPAREGDADAMPDSVRTALESAVGEVHLVLQPGEEGAVVTETTGQTLFFVWGTDGAAVDHEAPPNTTALDVSDNHGAGVIRSGPGLQRWTWRNATKQEVTVVWRGAGDFRVVTPDTPPD